MAVRCRAPVPTYPSHLSMTLHATFQSDSELRLSQGHVKYVMLGGPEVVVGTSIAPYDLMHASWCCGGPLPRPRPHLTLIYLSMTLHATLNAIMSLEDPTSVSRTRCLAAL